MVMLEEWRPVSEYEGLYEVSSEGRIRSTKRTTIRANGRPLPIKERILSPAPAGGGGYLAVNVCFGTGRKTVPVHKIVLGAFSGPRPDGFEAMHMNGDRTDNRIKNLSWGTRGENQEMKVEHGTTGIGKRFKNLGEEKVLAIRKLYDKTEATQKDLASLFGVCEHTIGRLINRKSWTWV